MFTFKQGIELLQIVQDAELTKAISNEQPINIFNLACVAGGMRERASGGGAANFPRGRSPRVNSRAAKPRVNFPPAAFRMVFTCRPLLSLANQT